MEVLVIIGFTDDFSAEIRSKYSARHVRKFADKPPVVKVIANRTFGTGIAVLSILEDFPFHTLSNLIYVYCKDSQLQWLTREYEGQIELAGANPERFIFQLHKFYNEISNKIRKQNLYQEIVDFYGSYMELVYTHSPSINRKVVEAYTNLIIQTIEYLRPNKFDLTRRFVGASTDGHPLYGPQSYPYLDTPALEMEELAAKKKDLSKTKQFEYILNAYKQQGLDIKTANDLNNVEHSEKLNVTMHTLLLPYINEYTCDILPQDYYYPPLCPMVELSISESLEDIQDKLKARKRTLPLNGTHVVFTDPSGEIKEMLLKEIVKNNVVIMLYRLTTDKGDLAGYYNTQSGFLYSAVLPMKDEIPGIYKEIQAFILYCYALCVTNQYTIDAGTIKNKGENVELKTYNIGGKLKNVYTRETSGEISARIENPDYITQTAPINGYIRKLPAGQKASGEAMVMAMQMGYELDPDETYVRPFCKTVFVRKQTEELNL